MIRSLSRLAIPIMVALLAATVCLPAGAAALDPLLGPPNGGEQVVVRAGFQLRDINSIDDEAETFEFSGVLTLKWQDPRQAFDPAETGVKEKIYQGDYQFNELSTGWYPQIFLANQSGMFESSHLVASEGSPWIPNCTTNPGTTRKNLTPSKKPFFTRL